MTLIEKHKALLDRAVKAIHERTFYAPYPEHHSNYGEENIKKGEQDFLSLLGGKFEMLQDGEWVEGEEESPFTGDFSKIKYPVASLPKVIENASACRSKWSHASVSLRASILAESLERVKEKYFLLAYSTMHTSGQSFMMAFQASGPHAADRALEACAMAYHEQLRFPSEVIWEKPMGKSSVKLKKEFLPHGRGVSLVIGCSTFPAWNTVPGMYASLACGNPVIVKPHPRAVLPAAIYVQAVQYVLQENGFDPLTVQLVVDSSSNPASLKLAENKHVKMIDYTGNSEFGSRLENLPGKITFTEKTGVNSVIIDSVNDLDAVLQNLAFSISLYSGQMCTAPQNFFIPESGVKQNGSSISFDDVASRFSQAISNLVNNPKVGPGTFAAVQNPATLERIKEASESGKTIASSSSVEVAGFEKSRTVSPLLMEVSSSEFDKFDREWFGPIAYLIKTKDTSESISLATKLASERGAITCAAYTTDEETKHKIKLAMTDSFTPVSFNLTGFIWVNQAAAFSDFHVSGGNPAGNASFVNPDYVNKRFVWVQHRELV